MPQKSIAVFHQISRAKNTGIQTILIFFQTNLIYFNFTNISIASNTCWGLFSEIPNVLMQVQRTSVGLRRFMLITLFPSRIQIFCWKHSCSLESSLANTMVCTIISLLIFLLASCMSHFPLEDGVWAYLVKESHVYVPDFGIRLPGMSTSCRMCIVYCDNLQFFGIYCKRSQ